MNICIYHGVDLDGYCSAAIWKRVHPDGELIGMNYGDDVPWERLEGQIVTVVDFCLQPWTDMERLHRHARELTWIDHHKSAIQSWKDVGCPYIRGARDVTKAACELTWEFYRGSADASRGVPARRLRLLATQRSCHHAVSDGDASLEHGPRNEPRLYAGMGVDLQGPCGLFN